MKSRSANPRTQRRATRFLLSHVGNTWGELRSEEPRCGSVEIDVVGTAQGIWDRADNPGQQGGDESRFVSLPPDTLSPATDQLLELGAAELGAGEFSIHTATSGRVNRAFRDLRGDGLIYCYTGGIDTPRSHLLSLDASGRLRIEQRLHAAGAKPLQR